MLLVIDAGNTNVVTGLYREETLLATWRMASQRNQMPDEYAMLLQGLFQHAGYQFAQVDGVVLSSVVPPLTRTFQRLAERYFHQKAITISHQIDIGVRALVDNPTEVGSDRLVNTLAAHTYYGGPAIVIDFGTATSFDVVSERGDFLGGAIAPGLLISMEALADYASQLSRIEVLPPPAAIGKNTIHCMQSGILYGYAGLVEGLVSRIQQELPRPAKVIGTGGLSTIISHHTTIIEIIDPELTLKGLRLVYLKQKHIEKG